MMTSDGTKEYIDHRYFNDILSQKEAEIKALRDEVVRLTKVLEELSEQLKYEKHQF